MTDQIKAVQYLDRKVAILHLGGGRATDSVRILHIDAVGVHVAFRPDEPRGPQAFYPWTSIDHVELVGSET